MRCGAVHVSAAKRILTMCVAWRRDFHVYEQPAARLAGYVRTQAAGEEGGGRAVYALDCEMCYTMDGTELTRVTVVDGAGTLVYDTLVRPAAPVLDYNTRYSGITAESLSGVTTTLADVQRECLRLFAAQTILVGHSLNSDLAALKMLHSTVVDTSCVYPNPRPPHKYSLRHLAQTILGRFIQQNAAGHDSHEDALAALDLVKAKVAECRYGLCARRALF
jgi:RNA exonuclease 1